MNDGRTRIEKLFAEIPSALWSPGRPVPYVYRGSPVEMVTQMAKEMGPGVTVNEALDTLLEALARSGRMRLKILGNPPQDIRSAIFVYSLLQNGVLHRMAQA